MTTTTAPLSKTMKKKLTTLIARAAAGEHAELHEIITRAGYLPVGHLEHLKAKDVGPIWSISPQAVGLWHRRDGAPRNSDRTYNLSELISWRERQIRAASEGSSKENNEARLKKFQADLKEIDLKKAIGELLRREEVERGRIARVMEVRKKLQAMPKALAGKAANRPPVEVQAIIEAAVRSIIEDFAREPTQR